MLNAQTVEQAHVGAAGIPYMARCDACDASIGCTREGNEFRFVEHMGKVFTTICPNSGEIAPKPRC